MMKLSKLIFCVCLLSSMSAFASDGVCAKCVRIREENAKKPPNPYYYYEDYLKSNGVNKSDANVDFKTEDYKMEKSSTDEKDSTDDSDNE